MKPEEIEDLLTNAQDQHLTREMLISYRDQVLDDIRRDFVETHLKRCPVCERALKTITEEKEALENREITAEHRLLAREAMKQRRLSRPSLPSSSKSLGDYLKQIAVDWKKHFGQMQADPVRAALEPWTCRSEGGVLSAQVALQKNFDLTILFTSTGLQWENRKIRFRMGPFHYDVILKRDSNADAEIYAEVVVPLKKRTIDLTDISIDEL